MLAVLVSSMVVVVVVAETDVPGLVMMARRLCWAPVGRPEDEVTLEILQFYFVLVVVSKPCQSYPWSYHCRGTYSISASSRDAEFRGSPPAAAMKMQPRKSEKELSE